MAVELLVILSPAQMQENRLLREVVHMLMYSVVNVDDSDILDFVPWKILMGQNMLKLIWLKYKLR